MAKLNINTQLLEDLVDQINNLPIVTPEKKNVQCCPLAWSQKIKGTYATTLEITVNKTGTYDIYWAGLRGSVVSGTSSYYSQVYIDGIAYGSTIANSSDGFLGAVNNVSLSEGQIVQIYATGNSTSTITAVYNLIIQEI